MSDLGNSFVKKSRSLITSDYLPKIQRCLDRLGTNDIWWRPNDVSNSIGNLVLHLCGNVTQWIIGGVGQRPYVRQRQQEFDERRHISAAELRGALDAVVQQADEILSTIDNTMLLDDRHIQGYDVSVLDAIYHVVEHFSMHTGQIILLSKARIGEDLKLYAPAPSK